MVIVISPSNNLFSLCQSDKFFLSSFFLQFSLYFKYLNWNFFLLILELILMLDDEDLTNDFKNDIKFKKVGYITVTRKNETTPSASFSFLSGMYYLLCIIIIIIINACKSLGDIANAVLFYKRSLNAD